MKLRQALFDYLRYDISTARFSAASSVLIEYNKWIHNIWDCVSFSAVTRCMYDDYTEEQVWDTVDNIIDKLDFETYLKILQEEDENQHS
jgi:hypothetical protein